MKLKMFFRQIFVITWTDFKQLTFHPLFFLAMGLCCIFISYMFPRELMQFASSYIAPAWQQAPGQTRNIHFDVFVPHVSLVNLLLIFLIPAFSMKLLAEERKNKTFDLLMTVPLSSLQIVLGKYLALILTLILFLIVTMLYPLSTIFFTKIPTGPFLTSWLGLFFLAATYAAAGLFASSLTASVMLSMIMGVIFNISLLLISHGKEFSDNPIFQNVMEYISLSEHFVNFIKGSLVISSLVFFFSCILFFLFLVYKVIEFSRWRS